MTSNVFIPLNQTRSILGMIFALDRKPQAAFALRFSQVKAQQDNVRSGNGVHCKAIVHLFHAHVSLLIRICKVCLSEIMLKLNYYTAASDPRSPGS